jgi:Zn-dependent protease with chaperone function
LQPKKIILSIIAAQLLTLNVARADEAELSVVPDTISDIYSDVDMRVRLAAKPNTNPCVATVCELQKEFDARVQQLGAQLSASAYGLYPTLKKRVPQFSFGVIDKKEPGTASNGAGKVVLFRGLQEYELTDDALGFIMAREMGHVIGKHHSKNTYTKLIISALATVAFPAFAVIGASSAAAQATTATTLLTSAASTATSMVGSEVALAKMKPSQLAESDAIALKLLSSQEWDLTSVASNLQFEDTNQNSWTQDLKISNAALIKMVEAENLAVPPIEDDYVAAQTSPLVTDEPATTIGLTIEDVDLTEDTETAETNIDHADNASADVTVEAIRSQ